MSTVNPIAFEILKALMSLFEKAYMPIYSSTKDLFTNELWGHEFTALVLVAFAMTVSYIMGKEIKVRKVGAIFIVIVWTWILLIFVTVAYGLR